MLFCGKGEGVALRIVRCSAPSLGSSPCPPIRKTQSTPAWPNVSLWGQGRLGQQLVPSGQPLRYRNKPADHHLIFPFFQGILHKVITSCPKIFLLQQLWGSLAQPVRYSAHSANCGEETNFLLPSSLLVLSSLTIKLAGDR